MLTNALTHLDFFYLWAVAIGYAMDRRALQLELLCSRGCLAPEDPIHSHPQQPGIYGSRGF
jgi:hypothetical protein